MEKKYSGILLLICLLIISNFMFADGDKDNTGTVQVSSQSLFNPQISVIGDFLFFYSDLDDSILEDGFDIREVEVSFSSNIDVFARADFYFGIHRESDSDEHSDSEEHDHSSIGPGHPSHYAMHLEEGYVTFLALPADFQLKLGKIRTAVGRANTKHLHSLNWIDYPLVVQNYFGDEGMAGVGGELSWLTPLPFYTEIKYQLLHDESDAYFNTGEEAEWYHNFHWKSFFELGADHSLELGFSYFLAESQIAHEHEYAEEAADNDAEEEHVYEDIVHSIFAANMTYMWRPAIRAKYTKIILTAEYYYFMSDNDELKDSTGLYAALDYQFASRWMIGARYDYTERPYDPDRYENHISGYFTFIQSEYAYLRAGYTFADISDAESDNRFYLQLNFGIGPHRAHDF
ncbi:MAG: hypothetical protein JW737_08940 [Acidobacteria bacterium]|nr:hypothetical protein [Acidobacteriota bacterium]